MDENKYLDELQSQPAGKRMLGYLRLSGPGYMQSAMTLGGGSVASCVVMASMLGYKLLWVQPLAIILGFAVLAAIAKQTCHTGERPYKVFWERLHPILAIAWGASALIATIIWHIPQYSLTANGVGALAGGAGIDLGSTWARLGIGVVVLLAAIYMLHLYNSGATGLKLYELAIKVMVWLIVIAFGVVAIGSGIEWRRLFMGITGIAFLQDVFAGTVPGGAIKPIVGALAAAVGINMIFLYPYSLLNKNWGKKHKELAYFDLGSGMVIPFLIATTFMMIGTANAIGPEEGAVGEPVRNILDVAEVLSPTFGEGLALLLIGLGMTAVGFSTITTHMLASGFIGCEMFGFEHNSKARFWFALLPAIGIIGVVIKFPWFAAITASSLAAPLMPLAVMCFLILLFMRSYMGEERPSGGAAVLWAFFLVASIVVMSIASYFSLTSNWATLKKNLGATEEAAALAPAPEPAPEAQAEVSEAVTFHHQAMATEFVFTVYPGESGQSAGDLRMLVEEAFAAIDDLEARASRWEPDSQVARINNQAGDGPVKVAPDVMDLLLLCKQFNEETDYAFDITAGPIINVWGIYADEGRMPTDEAVLAAKSATGFDKVLLDADLGTVAFANPDMEIDLGGILKGKALDCAAEVLRLHGVTSAILHGGTSTLVAIGAPPGEAGWTVRIRDPYNDSDGLEQVVILDESLSTSGGYEKVFRVGDTVYGHIVDPRSARPAEGMLSASAIAPTGAESDALSTAFFVLGVEGTRDYCASHPEVRALLVPASEERPPEVVRINFKSKA